MSADRLQKDMQTGNIILEQPAPGHATSRQGGGAYCVIQGCKRRLNKAYFILNNHSII